MNPTETDVIIIGAGLAGLTAAKYLERAGKRVVILEASDRPGGRIKTDIVDGFRLDRGFQVFLTAYPEAKEQLNYDELDLQHFNPGAMVLHGKGKSLVSDPFRDPSKLFATLFSSVGSLPDKLKVLKLRRDLKEVPVAHLFRMPDMKTWDFLRSKDFSHSMLYSFFLPFFRGIFLEENLETSSRMFDFVFKMFSEGETSIPRLGMEEIPKQIQSHLVRTEIELNSPAAAISGTKVVTKHGESFTAKKLLVACEPNEFVKPFNPVTPDDMHGTINLYFEATVSPQKQPYLVLNGSEQGIVNSFTVMNAISPDYAPEGKYLISVSLVGVPEGTDEELAEQVKTDLKRWYGNLPDAWKLLRVYRIHRALPKIPSLRDEAPSASFKIGENLFATGDYMLNGSIHGALKAGRLAANALLEDLA